MPRQDTIEVPATHSRPHHRGGPSDEQAVKYCPLIHSAKDPSQAVSTKRISNHISFISSKINLLEGAKLPRHERLDQQQQSNKAHNCTMWLFREIGYHRLSLTSSIICTPPHPPISWSWSCHKFRSGSKVTVLARRIMYSWLVEFICLFFSLYFRNKDNIDIVMVLALR